MIASGAAAHHARTRIRSRIVQQLAIVLAFLLVITVAVALPAEATGGSVAEASAEGATGVPSPNPDVPIAVRAVATERGTELSWRTPLETKSAPAPTDFTIISCGPFQLGSTDFKRATAALCDGEVTADVISIPAKAPGERTRADIDAKEPVYLLRSDGTFETIVGCRPTATDFCVLAIGSVAATGRSGPVVVGSGGVAPSAPTSPKASPTSSGGGLQLSWTAAPDAEQAAEMPPLAQTYEVWRDDVLLARGLEEPEYVDESCGIARRCTTRIVAVTSAGRSSAIEVTALTGGTKSPSITPQGEILAPGSGVIAGITGDGVDDQRPVVVTIAPSGALAGRASATPITVTPEVRDGAWNVTVPESLVPGNYRVTASQSAFTSAPIDVGVARVTPLTASIAGTPADGVARMSFGPVRISGAATPTPPASTVAIRELWTAVPVGTGARTQSELSAWFARSAATTKIPVRTVDVDADGSWSTALATSNGFGERHVVEVTQIVPGSGTSSIYLEFDLLDRVPIVRGRSTGTILNRTSVISPQATAPLAPSALAATPGNGSASIAFTAGSNGGSAITNHQYQIGNGAWTALNPIDTTSPVTIPGLTNGTAYSIKLRAISAAGIGAASTAVNVTPRTTPSRPTALVATAGDRVATIAFTAGPNGGSAVTNYQYRLGTGNWTTLNPVDATSPVTIAGLTNGTAYSIRLRAVNAAGQGAESDAVSVTPLVPSAAPTSLVATPGDRSVSIAFVAGAAGTSAITNYQYQLGNGAWTALSPADASSPVTISGLTNGTAYSIKLRAVGLLGAGNASLAVSATPRAMPTAPAALVATPGDRSASIAFSPAVAGTGAITNYEYQIGNGAWTALSPADTSSPVTVRGLVNGTSSSIRLRAVSSYGGGAASTPVSVTSRVLPTAPTAVVATPGDASASIAFTNGTYPTGVTLTGSITNYEYRIGSGSWTALSPADTASPIRVPGLVNGNFYSIAIRAVTAFGAGAASAAVTVTPRTMPPPPIALVATYGDKSISVAFDQDDDGGASITNYEYQILPGSWPVQPTWPTTWTALAPVDGTSPVTISKLQNGASLVNGTSYTLRLRAVNAAGAGVASARTVETPRVAPSAPTITSSVAGDQLVTLTISAGAAGTYPITGYLYQMKRADDPNDYAFWSPVGSMPVDSKLTIRGGFNGTAYKLRIAAVNSKFQSVASNEITFTPRTVPSAPTALVATPGDRSVSIAFVAGSDGGSAITNYKYQIGDGAWTALNPIDSTSPLTIAGLTNGTSYTFKLRAINAAGDGATSDPVTVRPGGTPIAPTGVSVVSKDGAATVSFTAPPVTGLPITAYTVSTTDPTPTSFTCTSLLGAPEPTCTLNGLTNGRSYSFTVTARNSAGTSPSSIATSPVVIGGPRAPTDVIASARDGSVDVAWTAPPTPAGMFINSYEVSVVGDATKRCTTSGPLPGDEQPPHCEVFGLTNGTAYSFVVRASAIVDGQPDVTATGATSLPSDPVTPAGLPTAPSPVTAYSLTGGAIVVWSTPSSSGGAEITGYTVTVRPSATQPTVSVDDPMVSVFDPTARLARISGLADGVAYDIEVAAMTAGGSGPAATTSSFWAPVATKPLDVLAVPGDRSAVVSWTEPEIVPVPIQSYTVTATNYYDATDVITKTADSSPFEFGDLRNGLTYSFTVIADNDAGSSPISDASATVIPAAIPSVPTDASVDAAPGTVSVFWYRPLDDGGREIESYSVEISTSQPGRIPDTKIILDSSSRWDPVRGVHLATQWSGLVNGYDYTVRIAATNAAGTSEYVTAGTVMPRGRASAPELTALTPSNGTLTADFTAPSTDGGSPILSYEVSDDAGHSCTIDAVAHPGITRCTVTGLVNGQTYSFRVRATNGFGTTDSVGRLSGAPTALVPGTPTGLTAAGIDRLPGSDVVFPGIIQATWTAPSTDGGSPIIKYVVTNVWDSSQSCSAWVTISDPTPTSCAMFGFVAGYGYSFRVVAHNAVGASVASSVSAPAYAGGTPNAPDITSITGGSRSVDVGGGSINYATATATVSPGRDNGSAIIGYRIRAIDQATQSAQYFTSSTSTITADQLLAGRAYKLSAQALNAFGYGDWSAESATIHASYPPLAATGVSAVPTEGAATVNFTPPSWNGSDATYTVTVNDLTDGTSWTEDAYGSSTYVDGLTNGHSYTFAITATNFAGSGPISSTSSPVTPLLMPNAPQNVVATSADTAISVAFDAPIARDGAPITTYKVSAYNTWSRRTTTVTGASSPIRVTGLTNGAPHQITVVAMNDGVDGQSVVVGTSVTPAGIPSMVVLGVTYWDDASTVVTLLPVNLAGGALVRYNIFLSEMRFTDAGSVLVPVRTIESQSTTVNITGLTNGVRYFVQASITTTGGTSPVVNQGGAGITPMTIPGAPTVTGVRAEGTTASISIDPPTDNGGSAITGYTVTATSTTDANNTRTASGSGSPVTVSGLIPGDSYSFSAVATNATGSGWQTRGGPGPSSAAMSAAPGAPTDVAASEGDGSTQITWNAPAPIFGETVTSYRATASPGGSSCESTVLQNCLITGLTNYTTYTVTVLAMNSGGSTSSAAVDVTPKPVTESTSVTSAPRSVMVDPSSGSLVVTWNMPIDDGGGAIRYFTATASPGGATCTSQALTTCAIAGVDPYAIYSVAVTATNSIGTSAAGVSAEVSRCGLPTSLVVAASGCNPIAAAATSVRAETVDGGVKVSWNPQYRLTSTATASPTGGSCSANYWTGPRNSDNTVYCVIPGEFDPTTVFHVSSGSWPPDTSGSVRAKRTTLSVPSITREVTPHVTGTVSSGTSVTVVASPASCTDPLVCPTSTRFPTAVVGGSFDVEMSGLDEGTYNVFVVDPDPTATLGLTTPRSMMVDRTAPLLDVNSSSSGVDTVHAQDATIFGTVECPTSTTFGVDWYVGSTISGSPFATTNPTRTPSVVGDTCSFTNTISIPGDGTYLAVVSMTDIAGNTSTVEMAVIVDNSAPALTVAAPAVGATAPAGVFVISGSAPNGDGDRSMVTVSASDGSMSFTRDVAVGVDGTFVDTVMLGEGTWNFTISRTDLAGNLSTVSRSLSVIAGREDVRIEVPTTGASVSGQTRVIGWAIPGSEVLLSSDSVELGGATATSDGSWSAVITLPSGAEEIVASVGESSHVVEIVDGPPSSSLTIASPGVGGRTNGRALFGTGAALSNITVTIDGTPTVVSTDAFGNWNFDLAGLAEGAHVVSASDGAGGTAVTSIAIERSPPVLEITSPSATHTHDPDVTVLTSDADGDSAFVELDYYAGTDLTVDPIFTDRVPSVDGIATGSLPGLLANGQWTLVARRHDASGNSGSAQVTFDFDTIAPVASTNIGPAMVGPLSITGAGGTADGDLPVEITVDGVAWNAPSTGAFTFTPSPAITTGNHVVVVTQADTAGNVTTTTYDVKVDSIAPNLSLTDLTRLGRSAAWIQGQALGNDGPVTVEATPDDPTVNTAFSTSFSQDLYSRYSGRLTLAPGWWTLSITRTDTAGNVATITRRYLSVDDAPNLAIVSPVGSTRNGIVTVAGATSSESWRSPTVRVVISPTGSADAAFTADVDVVDGGFLTTTPVLPEGSYSISVTRDDSLFPATATGSFAVDTIAPSLEFDLLADSAIGSVCGTAGTATGDVASIGLIWTAGGAGSTVARTVTPVAGRFCASPPWSGLWSVTATQFDGTGSSTVETSANFDVLAPSPTISTTSASTDPAVDPPWAGRLTGTAGTGPGDVATVTLSLTLDRSATWPYSTLWNYLRYCHETLEFADGLRPCARSVEVPVAPDGSWSLDLSSFEEGFWHVSSVAQADEAGNVGRFVAIDSQLNLAEIDAPKTIVNRYRYRVDHVAAPMPVLARSSNGVTMSVCNPSSPYAYTAQMLIYSGAATGTPVATVPMPTASLCASSPTQLLKQNRPGSLPVALPNGDYSIVGESIDPMGDVTRSSPLSYRSDWVVPVVTSMVTGTVPRTQDAGGPTSIFGEAVTVSGTAASNSVDPSSVKLTITQNSGDSSYRSILSNVSEIFVADVPIQSDGTWSLRLPSTFPIGTFTANVTQGAGSAPGVKFAITGAAPAVDSVTMRASQQPNGSIVKTITISGSAPTDRTLDSTTVSLCGIVTVTNGRWTCSVTGDYADGSTRFTVLSKTSVAYSRATTTAVWSNGVRSFETSFSASTGLQSSSSIYTTVLTSQLPKPIVTSPAPTSSVPITGSVTVAGSAATANGALASITINIYSGSGVVGSPAQTATVSASGSPSAFSKAFTLTDGIWTIQAVQSDSNANTGVSDPVVVGVDATAPTLTVSMPESGARMRSAFLTGELTGSLSHVGPVDYTSPTVDYRPTIFEGSVSYYAGASATGTPVLTRSINTDPVRTWSGGMYSYNYDNKWSDAPTLADGTWTAAVSATDAAGNITRRTVTFVIDPTAAGWLTPQVNVRVGEYATPLQGHPTIAATWSSALISVSTGFDAGRAPAISGGTVTLRDGDTVLGTAPLVDGSASIRVLWSRISSDYLLNVSYSGDSNYVAVTTPTVPVTAVAPAPSIVRLEPKFANGAANGGRFTMTVARPMVQSNGSTIDASCVDGGNATITDGDGRVLSVSPLSDLRWYFIARISSIVAGQIDRTLTTLDSPWVITKSGPQRLTLTTSGGRDCGPSSTTFDIDIPSVDVPASTTSVAVPTGASHVVGDEIAVTFTIDGAAPEGLPVSIVDSNGTVLAGPVNFVNTSRWMTPPRYLAACQLYNYCEAISTYVHSASATLRFTAASAGSLELHRIIGGGSSGYATSDDEFSVAVEPDRVALELSNSTSKPGEDATVSLIAGGPGLRGQVAIDGANTATEILSPTLECTISACGATSALPAQLRPFGTDGVVRGRFTSSVTGRTYELTRPLQRTLWQPTVTIAAGPGAPVGPAAVAAGSGRVNITWTAPSANGSTISGYSVVATPGGRTCTTTVATSCSISGLDDGTEYGFDVVALSDLGTSSRATAWATPTAAIVPPSPSAVAALPAGTVVRDRLVPVRSVLTFPSEMASTYRSNGTLTLTSAPDPTICAGGSRDETILTYCSRTRHLVTIDLAGATATESLEVNGIPRNLITSASLEQAGVGAADLTPTTTATWSGNTLTVTTQMYVGGTGFVLSADFATGSSASVMSATTHTAQSPTDVRIAGSGAPAVKISVAAAKITGGWYGPIASRPDPYYPSVTDFSGWDVRNPRVGETAFVKAQLDPVFSVPNDNNVPANLGESLFGAKPLFVQSDHGYRYTDDRMVTSATPALLGGRDNWNPFYDQTALAGLPSCSRCHIWTIRNLESTSPIASGGGLPVGSWPLGLMTYAPGTGTVVAGSAQEVAARTGITSFVLDVEPWATTQSAQVSLSTSSINVVTAARWQGMAPEVQAPYANVMVTIFLEHEGVERAIAICFYNGICLDDDGNGTAFLPASVTTIGARLAIVLPTETLGFTPTVADTVSVVTSAPWGVTADSGPMSLRSPSIVSNTTGAATVSVASKSMGVTLENQPSLSSPVPLFGTFGWEIADARAAFAQFGFDLFMSIFKNATVARIFMSITEVTLNFMPGYSWLNAATCGGWVCAAQLVGASVAGFALTGLSAGMSVLAKGWKAAKSALGIVDTPSRIGMFIARGTTAVNRTLLRLERAVPMRIKMAMSGESTKVGTVAKLYAKAYGKKGAAAVAEELITDEITNQVIGAFGFESTTAMAAAPVNLRVWRGDPRDPGFVELPQMTTAYSDAIIAQEADPDEAVLANWQGAIQRAYDKAANQTSPQTNIGYGEGIGYRLNQFFATVVSVSVPNLSGLNRTASTIWIGEGENEFGQCDLNGNCTMKPGVSAIVLDGSVLVSGLIPGWDDGGDHTIEVRVRTVASSGGAINTYLGSSSFTAPGSLYACRAILAEMDAIVQTNGGYTNESHFGQYSVSYTEDGRWYTFGNGTGALGRLVTSNIRASQLRLCESIEAMWSHLHGGMYPSLPAPQYVAPFDPSRSYSPQTQSLVGGF